CYSEESVCLLGLQVICETADFSTVVEDHEVMSVLRQNAAGLVTCGRLIARHQVANLGLTNEIHRRYRDHEERSPGYVGLAFVPRPRSNSPRAIRPSSAGMQGNSTAWTEPSCP